ncbi:MAG: hypothetical protein A2W52_02075 [Candidatus Taylorbacteria bacterium RIFCSPHIGHO2_02_49_25]|uniref:Uncharacterized protein n=1 Tax=Candidatus Taylorbacteria bacterium RIFCSPHIGHO2_02_49_25 TaxID=1802305 RepID=A0A1G2MHW7_9BACT|nr:MAG: hypothetical protein A2759_00950 [Candidatus Taylorbacteria bacterium RIFCSPHIGHO2_01_FULL_49_60]OHA23495.1 MAG: hypothetical protein A2W52_02075 [Candidatus Taylorbacteria bacterium RIFCSPHIGHO2_02_49_25]OHA35210.1 MAG: hypothetical protein A3B27_00605 [Candidatus Taylorbacteria bacterium RIFCSPLOWO2_01_FULL_50_130]OHA36848.1 MAG: hypothetical protein A2W65_00065 [Candidatus Taylorbacteria bacterium RIFCSPLOWO2_02_50_13]OHA41823.1 MAG: hypothetical protein A3H73_03885 [Candidatus Taylo
MTAVMILLKSLVNFELRNSFSRRALLRTRVFFCRKIPMLAPSGSAMFPKVRAFSEFRNSKLLRIKN